MSRSQDEYIERFLAVSRVALGLAAEPAPPLASSPGDATGAGDAKEERVPGIRIMQQKNGRTRARYDSRISRPAEPDASVCGP
jgi:hypothetical protein